ncbi:ProQ/FINO family protein [Photobacterium toruni]|uniref:ProQ/FINO family protein n=1 Tax=Photobacterium toruni TaxID=1935446 RepID=A0ABU6L9Q6_9GAMM|nr:ProQ/FINO family protein [Photobacterium toruni]
MIESEPKSKTLTLKRDPLKIKTGEKKPVRGKKVYKPTNNSKRHQLSKAKLLDKQEKLQRKQNIEAAQKWLCRTFPKAFNLARLVPLEIGIHKIVMETHKSQGGSAVLGFGWQPIKRALRKWTSRPAYIRLLTEESLFRRSAVGGISGEVTEEQAIFAKIACKKMKSRRVAKK